MRVSVAFACLIAVACAHETKERPAADPTPTARRESLPFPETAFSGDASDAGDGDRFSTRSIGPRAGEHEHERGQRYRGAPIDLDVKAADLHDVFRLIADVGKVNIVVAGEVSGTITLKLERMPWDQALDVVAKAKGLALERDGNVIIVRAH